MRKSGATHPEESFLTHPTAVANHKAIAEELFARFTASDFAGALDLMTEDATWWIPGKKERLPTAGLYAKVEIAKLFRRMIASLKDGLTMTVKSSIGEGDVVAFEVVLQRRPQERARLPAGVPHADDVPGRSDRERARVSGHTACA